MQKYEIVLLLDVAVKDSDRKALLDDFEKQHKDMILEKDDIGIQNLLHNIHDIKGNNKAYFVSYCLEMLPSQVMEVRKFFLYNKMIVRYDVFAMGKSQTFLHFEKQQKKLADIMEKWDTKRVGNKITFFSKKENKADLNRKSIPMLKKYLTRFGNIKPRKYTYNSVLTQKALRQELIRARSLGLLDFIR